MERRMRGNSHVRCEVGENPEITSRDYLSLSFLYLLFKVQPGVGHELIYRRGHAGEHCDLYGIADLEVQLAPVVYILADSDRIRVGKHR